MVKNVVIFDLDGTLVDTSAGIINSVKDTVTYFGLPPLNNGELMSFMGGSIYESFKRFYPEANVVTLVDYFRLRYSGVHFKEVQPYEGVNDLLEKLHEEGVIIGVATFKREDLAKRLLSSYPFYKFLHCICGSDPDGKLTKSDIINNCIELLNVQDKKSVLLIGDAPNDALSAMHVGVAFLGVAYGYGFKPKDGIIGYPNEGCVEIPCEILNYINKL